MKILIVDDEPLARERIRKMIRSEPQIELIAEAANGEKAIEAIRTKSPDIVFLDIQMPDMDGFIVLENLGAKRLAAIPAIVFVTAYDQYALRAFEFYAVDYLLKPFDRKRFAETFRRAKEQATRDVETNDNQKLVKLLEELNSAPEYLEWITVKKDERIRLLRAEDIEWIEAQGNYALLKFKDGSQMMRETMDNLEAKLNPQMFVRIHRSTIVNVNQIKELQVWARGEYRVVLKGGKMFTMSRAYRLRFETFLKKRAL